jgi:hypothetical protein
MSKRRRPNIVRPFYPVATATPALEENVGEVADSNSPPAQNPQNGTPSNMLDNYIGQLQYVIEKTQTDLAKAEKEVARLRLQLTKNEGALEGFSQLKQMGAEVTVKGQNGNSSN